MDRTVTPARSQSAAGVRCADPTHTDQCLIAAQATRADHPGIGVLVLSQYVEPSYAMRLIEDHPERVGYLLKERVFDIATVVDALRRIVDGETVIDPTIVARLLGRRRRTDPLAGLTGRLFATERTVEAHVTQILLKLGLAESPGQHRRVLAVLTFLRAQPHCGQHGHPGAGSSCERGPKDCGLPRFIHAQLLLALPSRSSTNDRSTREQ